MTTLETSFPEGSEGRSEKRNFIPAVLSGMRKIIPFKRFALILSVTLGLNGCHSGYVQHSSKNKAKSACHTGKPMRHPK